MSGAGPVKIKLCGMRRPEDIAAANRCLPDYVGFVFAPSKRRVEAPLAYRMKQALDPRIQAVGVFVNEAPEAVADLCKRQIIDVVQLHGDETEDYIRSLKARVACPVIKAVTVKDRLPPLPESADFLLFDAYNPAMRGGTGETFNWQLLRDLSIPYFLAGGLEEANLPHLLHLLQPYCVDISSGVETGGWKDGGKMERVVRLVRSNPF